MANKYNYQLRSFISSQFAFAGNRYFTCWCASDGNAQALRTALVPKMVNFTKIGLSRQIIETPSIIIPQQELVRGLSDVRLYRFWLQSEEKKYTIDIPLGKSETGLSDVISSIVRNCTDSQGNPVDVVAYRAYGIDIVQEGI